MLNEKTRTILKLLSPINETVVVEYPLMMVKNPGKSLYAFFDVSKYEDSFDSFGILNINEFLSVIGLAEDPVISLDDRKVISIQDAKTQTSKFGTLQVI
jgi:hypothetical protein